MVPQKSNWKIEERTQPDRKAISIKGPENTLDYKENARIPGNFAESEYKLPRALDKNLCVH